MYDPIKNDERQSNLLRIEMMFDKATTKNALNLLKMTATCHQKFYVILSYKSLLNGSKTTIVNVLNKLGYTYKSPKN